MSEPQDLKIEKLPFVITKDLLEKRRADYQAKLDQLVANANSLAGAIADIDFWLQYQQEGWNPDPFAGEGESEG